MHTKMTMLAILSLALDLASRLLDLPFLAPAMLQNYFAFSLGTQRAVWEKAQKFFSTHSAKQDNLFPCLGVSGC